MALRWGIVSAGLISGDFTTVLRTLPRSEHQVPLPPECWREGLAGLLGPRVEGVRVPDFRVPKAGKQLLIPSSLLSPLLSCEREFREVWDCEEKKFS